MIPTKKELIKVLTEKKAQSVMSWEIRARGNASSIACGYCQFSEFIKSSFEIYILCFGCPIDIKDSNSCLAALVDDWDALKVSSPEAVNIAKQILKIVEEVNVEEWIDKLYKDIEKMKGD